MAESGKAKEGSARVRALDLLGKATEGGIFTDRAATEEMQQSVEKIWNSLRTTLRELAQKSPLPALDELEALLAESFQIIRARQGKAPGRGNVVPMQGRSR